MLVTISFYVFYLLCGYFCYRLNVNSGRITFKEKALFLVIFCSTLLLPTILSLLWANWANNRGWNPLWPVIEITILLGSFGLFSFHRENPKQIQPQTKLSDIRKIYTYAGLLGIIIVTGILLSTLIFSFIVARSIITYSNYTHIAQYDKSVFATTQTGQLEELRLTKSGQLERTVLLEGL